MGGDSSQAQLDHSTETQVSADQQNLPLVDVSIDELIIGRTLNAPIYDHQGVLLLAEGSEITSEIKQNLKKRTSGNSVQLSASDLEKVTLRKVASDDAPQRIQIDENLTRKIDFILDNGMLNVKNNGPALKQAVKTPGRKSYDAEQREQLIQQHQENGKKLSNIMDLAFEGKVADGREIGDIAITYLKEMISDSDNVLTSIIGDNSQSELAAQSLETSLLSMAIAIEMGFDVENIKTIGIAGLVHDWGMSRIPQELLDSPKKLSRIEHLEIEKHPIYSLDILKQIPSLPDIVPIVAYQVHERPNGTGYPRGRQGEQIPIFSRIIAVADTFVALNSPRPYRAALMRYASMEVLLNMSKERALDPDVVRALLQIQSLFPIGSYVTLSEGSVAQVLRSNQNMFTKPIVQRIQNADGEVVDPELDEHLIDLTESDLEVQQALPTPGQKEIPFSKELLTMTH